ncbi:MAG: hypothetical protein JNM94_16820 [Phycisphaerae bacterium]|nr:hypothetical protein [Phycisphaerae bacterium]
MQQTQTKQIQQVMEKAQAALHRNAWFEAERLALKGLDLARVARDYALMARIVLPLQEARRQRLQLALDTKKVVIVDQPIGEEFRAETGCFLVQPPTVGADARRIRLAALEQEVPVAVVCREPKTRMGQCPIVAIGQVTIRTKIAPPKNWDKPTMAWFVGALESLGDAAIETLDRSIDAMRQVDALLARLDAIPDHERLHQELADACKQAARDIAEGRISPPRVVDESLEDGETFDEEEDSDI